MTTAMPTEVRAHAARTHSRKMTRAARGWLVFFLVGALVWAGLIALAVLALRVAP